MTRAVTTRTARVENSFCANPTSDHPIVSLGETIIPCVDSDEEKIRWFLVALYVCDVAGLLDETKLLKLAHIGEQYAGESTWREVIEDDLEISNSLIKSLYEISLLHVPRGRALTFILRGLGCPDAEARLRDALGDEFEA